MDAIDLQNSLLDLTDEINRVINHCLKVESPERINIMNKLMELEDSFDNIVDADIDNG